MVDAHLRRPRALWRINRQGASTRKPAASRLSDTRSKDHQGIEGWPSGVGKQYGGHSHQPADRPDDAPHVGHHAGHVAVIESGLVVAAQAALGKRLALLPDSASVRHTSAGMVDSAAAKGEEDHHRHDRDTSRHDGAGIPGRLSPRSRREDARSNDHPEQRNVLMEGELHLLIHLRSRRFSGGAFLRVASL